MKWVELAARPLLLAEALRTAWAFRSRRGILPSRTLIRWRVATAYGSPDAPMQVEDLVSFLEWRRELRAVRRRSR
ncbi:MAG TPA: hypothetical protein VK011_07875 [Acidimicrobiia bacterium]|nr:hypothetical protein [Acidimicrobiia bacterium]